jgi:predicted dehydrogenase
LFGRRRIISFESNGAFILIRGEGTPGVIVPGFRDIRGYRAMYRDFMRAIREGRQPEMSLECAMDDQRVMDQIYARDSMRTPDPESGILLDSARARPDRGRRLPIQ